MAEPHAEYVVATLGLHALHKPFCPVFVSLTAPIIALVHEPANLALGHFLSP
jgi:hypothetical protein